MGTDNAGSNATREAEDKAIRTLPPVLQSLPREVLIELCKNAEAVSKILNLDGSINNTKVQAFRSEILISKQGGAAVLNTGTSAKNHVLVMQILVLLLTETIVYQY